MNRYENLARWLLVSGPLLAYDNAGDITGDGRNLYAYDAEGRNCAVSGAGGYTAYIYDADGNRVAKGTVNGLNCNRSTDGFSLSASYVLGS